MTRTRKLTLRLLKAIINGRKLRGGVDSRTAACKVCLNLLAAVRMNTGREWVRGNRSLDSFVAEQRKIAADNKLGPGVRADACRRLVVLGGWAGIGILGDESADEYTRMLLPVVTAPVAQQAQQVTLSESTVERALAKYESSKGGEK